MKKLLCFIFGLFAFIPFVHAVNLDELKVSVNGVSPDSVHYGDNYFLSASSMESDKYTAKMSICVDKDAPDLNTECNYSDVDPSKWNNLKPGTYKVGISVKFKEGYDISNNFKWIINGEEMNPTQCGGLEGETGCERFFTVQLKDWKNVIPEVKVSGATINPKAGDKVSFTGKISDADSKLYNIVEGWCTDEDAAFGMGKGSCVRSDGKGYGAQFTTFEVGKTYYYLIEFATKYDSDKFESQDVVINDKKYLIADVSGIGDYGFGMWLPFSVTIAPEVKPADKTDEADKAAAEEASKTITAALQAVAENKEVKGISAETLSKIKAALNDGATLTSEVKSENVKADKVKEEVKKGVEEKTSKNEKVLGYFDVQVQVLAGNAVLGNITELQNPIRITLDTKEMVANLPAVAKGKKRVFSVLRFHGNKIDKLPATLNDDGTTSADSSDFSDYVVVYEDVDDVQTSNAPTGDFIHIYAIMLAVSLGGLIVVRKRVNA